MSDHASIIDSESPVAAVTAFDIETASPSDDLETLAGHMAKQDVGALVIESAKGEMSILTERDIVHAVAFDVDAWAVDVMTRDVIEVPADLSIADAAETMRTAGVRHLLVRQADGTLGITSIRDLLGPLLDSVD
jgi:predicted transcriptional regulator